MHITCPECQFTREIPDENLPARAQMATCPKCGLKFQFRELPPPSIFDPARRPAEAQGAESPGQPSGPLAPGGPGFWDRMEAPAQASQEDPPGGESARSGDPALSGPEPDPRSAPAPSPGPEAPRASDPGPEAGPAPGPEAWRAPGPESSRAGGFGPDPGFGPGRFRGWDDGEDTALPPVPPPFEQLEDYGFFPGLWLTIKRVLLSPRAFFQSMPLNRGIMKPLIFYLLLAEFQALTELFWSLAGISGVSESPLDGSTGRMVMGVGSALILIFYPLMLTAALFLGAGLNHLCLSLLRSARGGFEATFRAMAYSSAPFILCLVPVLGPLAGAVWSFAVALIGYKYLHRTTFGRVALALAVPVVMLLILALALMRSNTPSI